MPDGSSRPEVIKEEEELIKEQEEELIKEEEEELAAIYQPTTSDDPSKNYNFYKRFISRWRECC